jgi:uncharacterized protein
MHPPRPHQIDLRRRVHHSRGGVWPCQRVDLLPGGLHLGRVVSDNPALSFVDAYFLPALGLIANRFLTLDGSPYLRWYIDVARITPGEDEWTALDLYLDVVIGLDGRVEVQDTDEYLAAVQGGLLSTEDAAHALTCCHALLNGLATHGSSLEAWLATQGVRLPAPA